MSDQDLAYSNGVIMSPDTVFINAMDGAGTAVVRWKNGEFGHYLIDWPATRLTAQTDPVTVYAMGIDGDIHVFARGVGGSERRHEKINGPDNIGPLRCMCMVDGVNYVAGMQRQVYRREADDHWIPIAGAMLKRGSSIKGFNALDGFSATEIYAAGLDGELWRYDGRAWTPIDSRTEFALQHIACADNGVAYVVGQAGVLLEGRGHAWKRIDSGDIKEDFWSCAWFQGHLYIASSKAVYQLDDGVLRRIDTGATGIGTAQCLLSGYGMLWSIAPRHVTYSRDGEHWTKVNMP